MIQRHELSPLANEDELRYRNDVQLTEELYSDVEKWSKRQEQNKLSIIRFILQHDLIPGGEGLEIGAGTCWFTAELSKMSQVTVAHALDFSEVLLTDVAPEIVRRRNGQLEKIRFHVGDFHRLPFADASLDFVAADAALHHTDDLPAVLAEAFRVLKPGGRLLGIHEPGVPALLTPFNRFLVVKHGEHEKDFGIIENIYAESVWRDFFEAAGFNVRFLRFFGRRGNWRAKLVARTPLLLLNGLLFWSKVIVATKPIEAPPSDRPGVTQVQTQ
jgi:ubiquinone/menaquinone biosynthesis C-methylase UbiE